MFLFYFCVVKVFIIFLIHIFVWRIIAPKEKVKWLFLIFLGTSTIIIALLYFFSNLYFSLIIIMYLIGTFVYSSILKKNDPDDEIEVYIQEFYGKKIVNVKILDRVLN